MDSDPHPLEFPGSQVMIDALPLRKIDWQHTPLDPAFGHIKDSIEHCPHTQGARSSTAFGGGDHIFDPLPFLVGQVAWIYFFVHIPTVSPLLTQVASRNVLLLQSLPSSIPYRQANVRRRKDAHHVGTTARGIIERLYRVPRRLHPDGGPAGRVRCALSTGVGDRGRPAPHAPLPPGIAVPCATEEC